MKRKSLFLVSVFFAFLFTSCVGLFSDNKSGVSIRLPGGFNSRELLSDGTEIFYFTINCEKSDKSVSLKKDGVSGELVVFDDLPPGTYSISGKAYEDKEKTILAYEGIVPANVVGGQIIQTTLTMRKVTEHFVCDGEYSFFLPFNFMNNIGIKKYLGSQLETTYTLSTLPAEYSIWVDDLRISNDGSYNDNGNEGNVYENLLGTVPFAIKSSDAEASYEPLLKFDVVIALDSFDIETIVDSEVYNLAEAPITWDNIFENEYYPVYSYKYNSPDTGEENRTLSLKDNAVRIDRFYNTIGENLGSINLLDDSNWQWKVTVGSTTKNYTAFQVPELTSTDFTYNAQEVNSASLTCTFINTDISCRNNMMSRTRSMTPVLENVSFDLYEPDKIYYYYTNYLNAIRVDKTVNSGTPVTIDLSEIVDDPNYDVYFGSRKIDDSINFTASGVELYKKYFGTIPVSIKKAGMAEEVFGFTVNVEMEDFVIASPTFNSGSELLNNMEITEDDMANIVFQPYYKYMNEIGNPVLVSIDDEQMEVSKYSEDGSATPLVSLMSDAYWTWQIGVSSREDIGSNNSFKLDTSTTMLSDENETVGMYIVLISSASQEAGSEQYKIHLKYVLNCTDIGISNKELSYTLVLAH